MDDEMKAFVDRVRQHYDAIPAEGCAIR